MDRSPHSPDAFCNPWTFPRANQYAPGILVAPVRALVPLFQVPPADKKENGYPFGYPFLLVREAGLEPARPQ